MCKWHENDKFWEVMAPKLFDYKQLTEAKQEIDQIITLLGITPGSKTYSCYPRIDKRKVTLPNPCY